MNEIPLSLFQGLGIVLLVLILYTLSTKTLLTSLLSSIISYVMAQSIINGTVVIQYATASSGVINTPVRSMPVHYLLLMIAVIMTIVTFYILIMTINGYIENIGQNDEQPRWQEDY